MNIFLAPISNKKSYKNFSNTIKSGVNYSVIEPFLNVKEKKFLSKLEKIYIWGINETLKYSWNKMESGDIILFYKGREANEIEGKFIYAGSIIYKIHNRNLGLFLWKVKPGKKPWAFNLILENVKPIYINITDIAEYANYNKNFVVQKFFPLKKCGVDKILRKFNTVDNFIKQHLKQKNDLSN